MWKYRPFREVKSILFQEDEQKNPKNTKKEKQKKRNTEKIIQEKGKIEYELESTQDEQEEEDKDDKTETIPKRSKERYCFLMRGVHERVCNTPYNFVNPIIDTGAPTSTGDGRGDKTFAIYWLSNSNCHPQEQYKNMGGVRNAVKLKKYGTRGTLLFSTLIVCQKLYPSPYSRAAPQP